MEEKSFAWLLSELSKTRLTVRILEVAVCRGTKLLSWYYNDPLGVICRRQIKQNSKSKIVLSQFLNQRSPVLEEYNPDKIVAYLYHLKGIRMVKAKEAIELAENQLHGLQVRSIHLALPTSEDFSLIFRLRANYENGELVNEFYVAHYNKEFKEEVKDLILYERAINLTGFLSEFIYKTYGKQIRELELDLVPDISGHLYLLRLQKLIVVDENNFKNEPFSRRGARGVTVKVMTNTDEDEIEDGVNEINLYKNFLETLKKKEQGRIVRKQAPQNSPLFLDMIAKTFDRERKLLEHEEMIKGMKFELEYKSGACSPRHNNLSPQLSIRNKVKRKKQFGNINELLGYLEASRPKIWIRDKELHSENFSPLIKISSPISEIMFRDGSHSEFNGVKKLSKLENLLSPSGNMNRYQNELQKFIDSERVKLRNKLTNKERVQRLGKKMGKINNENS